jgi:hypothetical protein
VRRLYLQNLIANTPRDKLRAALQSLATPEVRARMQLDINYLLEHPDEVRARVLRASCACVRAARLCGRQAGGRGPGGGGMLWWWCAGALPSSAAARGAAA